MGSAEPQAPVTPTFKQPRAWIRWTAIVLAALGWWLSLQLLIAHDPKSAGNAWLDQLCGGADQQAAGWNCRSVLASKYGTFTLGERSDGQAGLRLPVATLGMGYFAFIGLWYLLVGPPTFNRRWYHLLIVFAVLWGLTSSINFIRIMAVVLEQWCLGCMGVHAINAVLVILTLLAWPWRPAAQPRLPHPRGRLVLAATIAGGLAMLVHVTTVMAYVSGGHVRTMMEAYREVVDDPEYILWNYRRQPTVDLPIRPGDPLIGNADAPYTVVVFSDFRCPRCEEAYQRLRELARTNPDKLRVAFRHFPQEGTCNPHPKFADVLNTGACRAALAAEAAAVIGSDEQVLALRTLMYERQGRLAEAPLPDWAAEVGLDPAAFETAFSSGKVRDRVAADIDLGRQLDITGVPVVYLNGKRLKGWHKKETWRAVLGIRGAEAPADTHPRQGPTTKRSSR